MKQINSNKNDNSRNNNLLRETAYSIKIIESLLASPRLSKSSLISLRACLALIGSALQKLPKNYTYGKDIEKSAFTRKGTWFTMDRLNFSHVINISSILFPITKSEIALISEDIKLLRQSLYKYLTSLQIAELDRYTPILKNINILIEFNGQKKSNLENIYEAILLLKNVASDPEIIEQSINHQFLVISCIMVVGNNLRYITRDQFISVPQLTALVDFYDNFREKRNIIAHANSLNEILKFNIINEANLLLAQIEVFAKLTEPLEKPALLVESIVLDEPEIKSESEAPIILEEKVNDTTNEIITLQNTPYYYPLNLWENKPEEKVENITNRNFELLNEIKELLPGCSKFDNLHDFDTAHVMGALLISCYKSNLILFDEIVMIFKHKINLNYNFPIVKVDGKYYIKLNDSDSLTLILPLQSEQKILELLSSGCKLFLDLPRIIIMRQAALPMLTRMFELGYNSSLLFTPSDKTVIKPNVTAFFEEAKSLDELRNSALIMKNLIKDYNITVDYQYICSSIIWYFPDALEFFAEEFLSVLNNTPLIQNKKTSFLGHLIHSNPYLNDRPFGQMMLPMIKLIVNNSGVKALLEVFQFHHKDPSVLNLLEHLLKLYQRMDDKDYSKPKIIFILAIKYIYSQKNYKTDPLALFFMDNNKFKAEMFSDEGNTINFQIFKTIMFKPISLDHEILKLFDLKFKNNCINLFYIIKEHQLLSEDEITRLNDYYKQYSMAKEDLIIACKSEPNLAGVIHMLNDDKHQSRHFISQMQFNDFKLEIDTTLLSETTKEFLENIKIPKLTFSSILNYFEVSTEIKTAFNEKFFSCLTANKIESEAQKGL